MLSHLHFLEDSNPVESMGMDEENVRLFYTVDGEYNVKENKHTRQKRYTRNKRKNSRRKKRQRNAKRKLKQLRKRGKLGSLASNHFEKGRRRRRRPLSRKKLKLRSRKLSEPRAGRQELTNSSACIEVLWCF